MNTRRALLLVLIALLLGLHTVYTRTAALDYSLRTGQLYANVDRLKEQRRELEVNLSILRQPVMAAEKASQYCPQLEPAHPELEAYHLSKDRPKVPVPSLRVLRASEAAIAARNATASPAGTPAPAASAASAVAAEPVNPAILAPDVEAEELDDEPSVEVTLPGAETTPPVADPAPAPVPQPTAVPVSGATHVH